MKERTLELAKQAGMKVEYLMTNPPKPFQILVGAEELEKLTELIVRECAQVCVEVGDANSDIYPEFGNGAYFSANRVKEHFGVEE